MDKTHYDILEIEGIGDAYGHRLNLAGIRTTGDLLQKAGTKKGRVKLAAETSLPETLILTWVNHADLMRINGIGAQISELLEASGVDSVSELAQRNPDNLHAKLLEVNEKFGLSGKIPSVNELKKMIAQAADMEKAVTH